MMEGVAGEDNSGDVEAGTAVTLKAAAITLLGVVLSIGLTVGFGIKGPWWLRVGAGVAVTVGLTVLVKLAAGSNRGPLARAANWLINAPTPR